MKLKRILRAAAFLLLGWSMVANAALAQDRIEPAPLEVDPIFREAFVALMAKQPGGWQLQAQDARASRLIERTQHQMTWRLPGDSASQRANRGGPADVSVVYHLYRSEDAARGALQFYRLAVSVATRDIKDLADEAVIPANGSLVLFRRGPWVFRVSARGLVRPGVYAPGVQTNLDIVEASSVSTIEIAKRFLDAADRVLAGQVGNRP